MVTPGWHEVTVAAILSWRYHARLQFAPICTKLRPNYASGSLSSVCHCDRRAARNFLGCVAPLNYQFVARCRPSRGRSHFLRESPRRCCRPTHNRTSVYVRSIPSTEVSLRVISANPPAVMTSGAKDAPLVSDSLSAYRRDLDRVGDVIRFSSADDRWLRRALRLEKLVATSAIRSASVQQVVKHPLLRPDRLFALTERIEAAGALLLAFNMLESARRIWDIAAPSTACVALLRQARICRTLGSWEVAERFYMVLVRTASRHGAADLVGQAYLGRGSMYYHLGELTSSKASFVRARSVAKGNATTVGASYHGEMAVALAQGDLSHAVVCGVAALNTTALRSHDRVGVLINIAAIAIRTGNGQAALHVLQRALRRTRHARLRIHIFAKFARAASSLNRPDAVDHWVSRFVREASRVNCPADELEARAEIAEAYSGLGQMAKARRIARSVRAKAVFDGLAVVAQRCDAILAAPHVAPPLMRLRSRARRQLLSLDSV